jgi:hypothetical protein
METYNKLNTLKFTFIKEGDNLIFESVEKIN